MGRKGKGELRRGRVNICVGTVATVAIKIQSKSFHTSNGLSHASIEEVRNLEQYPESRISNPGFLYPASTNIQLVPEQSY